MNMGNIKEDVFLGDKDQYQNKLQYLASLAQKETWTFKSVQTTDPFRILRNYFQFTYNRLSEEKKIMLSDDDKYACINTGLLTNYDQEIVAIFSKSIKQGYLPWFLVGFFRETDKYFTGKFQTCPKLADYFDNIGDVIFDKNLRIDLNVEHIIDDNFSRFQNIGYNDPQLINALLNSAKLKLEKKLRRNFKLALPFYYHNTETNENKIQLLVPVYFAGAPVRLALVLDKVTTSSGHPYYSAITVLPVEWAYMNSRLIVKPDEEWARIIDEADNDLINEITIDKN